ncbi:MAG: ATP-binding protein [Actinomycetes bacterium]
MSVTATKSASMSERVGLAPRLFAAQLLTVAVSAVTLIIVAALVGPPLLNAHLTEALGPKGDDIRNHVEQGYTRVAIITFVVAGVVSLAAAITVSMLATRRLARPIADIAEAATQVAVGDYQARVPAAGLGFEMDHLTTAFNMMADALQDTERARQRLLGDVAHELRTPLATIRAFHEALADGVRAPDEQTWAILAAQTDRIQRLIDDIALVSRAEEHALALHIQDTPVDDLVATAVATAGPAYQSKGVVLLSEVPVGLPQLAVDPDRIGQVLTNLLTNALRHTPPGGHVAIAARDLEHHHGQPADATVLITVEDDGDGIDSEHLPHLFERFYRVDQGRDREHGGSGIGLTIARALAQAHGGNITATSAGLGRGSTFIVELPSSIEAPTTGY